MGDCGCGEKDVEEIAREGAKMAQRLSEKLSGQDTVIRKPGPGQTKPEKWVVKRLEGTKKDLLAEQVRAVRREQALLRQMVLLCMPEDIDSEGLRFDEDNLEYYTLD